MNFTLTTQIKATPKQIYKSWLSTQRHSKMTGSPAYVSDKIGDTFKTRKGYITGSNIELEPYTRIVQSWRSSNFEDNESDSQIEILLSEDGEETTLTLNHTNVPEFGEDYKEDWNKHYFEPMKRYFEALNKA
ncbi:SRPBCC domain-containing protein [Winogradskyella immobilis]|uniref:SRPBCC domain-containing protein n=1 Tax=Winogradskyella immobilis TaxID=2816852 RepID=A0ABS8EL06_9FLAO|nr:SRPBCC domain-containing protein [Winogradskyella immobilis]MCC1483838.1 SRPBCC domain-containing protein [Winogradskyella immobilis]MCG0015932.1 SRPBCC domain-containing protein [Winogradskyella immobilis]